MAKRKKVAVELEIVEHCDKCGRLLGRQCVRTIASSICAVGDGVVVRRDSGIRYYCCEACAQ